MFANKAAWGLSDSLLLFAILLLGGIWTASTATTFHGYSVVASILILSAYYLGKDIRKQHTEYQSLINFEKTEKTLSNVFNLILAALLIFGIFNILFEYTRTLASVYPPPFMNYSELALFWSQGGLVYKSKMFLDFTLLVMFVMELLMFFFTDIIGFKLISKEPKHELHETRKMQIVPMGDEPKKTSIKKVKVTYSRE